MFYFIVEVLIEPQRLTSLGLFTIVCACTCVGVPMCAYVFYSSDITSENGETAAQKIAAEEKTQ